MLKILKAIVKNNINNELVSIKNHFKWFHIDESYIEELKEELKTTAEKIKNDEFKSDCENCTGCPFTERFVKSDYFNHFFHRNSGRKLKINRFGAYIQCKTLSLDETNL